MGELMVILRWGDLRNSDTRHLEGYDVVLRSGGKNLLYAVMDELEAFDLAQQALVNLKDEEFREQAGA